MTQQNVTEFFILILAHNWMKFNILLWMKYIQNNRVLYKKETKEQNYAHISAYCVMQTLYCWDTR